jgi:hypothetical protein
MIVLPVVGKIDHIGVKSGRAGNNIVVSACLDVELRSTLSHPLLVGACGQLTEILNGYRMENIPIRIL